MGPQCHSWCSKHESCTAILLRQGRIRSRQYKLSKAMDSKSDLPEADMKEILHNRMWESKSYQTHEDHMTLYEALEKSMARDNSDQLLFDLAEARKKKKKRQGSPKTPPGSPPHPPPPPSPPAGPFGTLGASDASGSS
ncbi:hypothetical protein Tco_0221674 [Tanacetum coccineum]